MGKLETKVTEEQVTELMKETGFGYPGGPDSAANLDLPVTSYSGGWKMKMQLCAAKLVNADVLMLDEPTGHLDVNNIKWLEDWLEAFSGSIICTSHFSPFLDKMCTHIIDFQDRKLKTFKGEKGRCLDMFVEKYSEKRSYFELSNEIMKLTFPLPGPLEGVKSRSKIVLRMNNVDVQYPTKTKPTVMDVTLTVSQVSRVAVIGANGAGKTTAIKALVGEQMPSKGSIWKAPGLRMAYVAQHAFHHLEKHMQLTPTQYIMWRFAGNDDKESVEFKTDELSVDETAARERPWCIDSVTGEARLCITEKEDPKKHKLDITNVVVPDAVLNRKQNKEFCDGVATEKWIMNKGYLRIEGESVDTSEKDEGGNKAAEVVYDGAGNKIDVTKQLSEKEKKKAIKDLEKKMKEDIKKGLLTEEEQWEMDDKLQLLKDSLVA